MLEIAEFDAAAPPVAALVGVALVGVALVGVALVGASSGGRFLRYASISALVGLRLASSTSLYSINVRQVFI